MDLTVLDAGIVIAILDANDSHHAAATSALAARLLARDGLILPASAYAEVLVAPHGRGESAVRCRPYCARWNVREVFERLERLGVGYYMTGSEALARYGEPRQTMDVDIVVGLGASAFDAVARAFEDDFLVNEPVDFGTFSLASLIAKSALGKADLILDRRDAWSRSAMGRRVRWDHPLYGPLWVISLEDLVLAKLEWSKGISELQLRDCRNLLALNRGLIDWPYVERWAAALGVSATLAQVRDAG